MLNLALRDIHIWTQDIDLIHPELYFDSLSLEEKIRAEQFKSPLHRHRYIVTRGYLRQILGFYLSIPASAIIFSYDENNKPFLNNPNKIDVQFNLSHPASLAVYAIRRHFPIGVDIEKIKDSYTQGVADYAFTAEENSQLLQSADSERAKKFYTVWTRKEAMAKALSTGLAEFKNFTVSAEDIVETIKIKNGTEFQLIPLSIDLAFQAAIATAPSVIRMFYYSIIHEQIILTKSVDFSELINS